MVQSVTGVTERGNHGSQVMLSLRWLKQNLICFCMWDEKRKNQTSHVFYFSGKPSNESLH